MAGSMDVKTVKTEATVADVLRGTGLTKDAEKRELAGGSGNQAMTPGETEMATIRRTAASGFPDDRLVVEPVASEDQASSGLARP